MKFKDVEISLSFKDGAYQKIIVKGYSYEVIDTGTLITHLMVKSGKEKFLEDADKHVFIDLGNEARRYKDIRHAHFQEFEREK